MALHRLLCRLHHLRPLLQNLLQSLRRPTAVGTRRSLGQLRLQMTMQEEMAVAMVARMVKMALVVWQC